MRPSPTSSGPSSLSAPRMRPAAVNVRRLREPISMGSYMDMSLVSRHDGRDDRARGCHERRRNLWSRRLAEDELVQHAARDRCGCRTVLAVLDDHRHRELRIVRGRERDEPAVIEQAFAQLRLHELVTLVLRDREDLGRAGFARDLVLRTYLA